MSELRKQKLMNASDVVINPATEDKQDTAITEQSSQGTTLDSILQEGGRDFLTEVHRGNITGLSCVHKFGANHSVPNGSFAFVTTLGQTAHALSAHTTVRIKAGGNVADTSAGAGASPGCPARRTTAGRCCGPPAGSRRTRGRLRRSC